VRSCTDRSVPRPNLVEILGAFCARLILSTFNEEKKKVSGYIVITCCCRIIGSLGWRTLKFLRSLVSRYAIQKSLKFSEAMNQIMTSLSFVLQKKIAIDLIPLLDPVRSDQKKLCTITYLWQLSVLFLYIVVLSKFISFSTFSQVSIYNSTEETAFTKTDGTELNWIIPNK